MSTEERLNLPRRLRDRIGSEGFATVEAYRHAPGWMRGDPGRLVAELRVQCGRCGRVLAVVFKRQADGYRDGVLRSREPMPADPGTRKVAFRCAGCGASPRRSLASLSDAVDGIARPGHRTTGKLPIA